MNKKGFTLVELLAVITIIAIITLIGTVGITTAKDGINKKMWEETIKEIETAATHYGEDHKNKLKTSCIEVKVQDLINDNYLTTKKKNSAGEKIIVNDTLEPNNANYVVNDYRVNICLENDIVYANLIQ